MSRYLCEKSIFPPFVRQMSISTNTEVAVLSIKKITRLIPKVLVMRHLLRGTTINILDNVKNKETVETRSVGEIDTRYSSWDVIFMYNPATPTPRRMSSIRKSGIGGSTQHRATETGRHRHHGKSHSRHSHI